MAAATRRKQAPVHPTVFVGLALALVGLLIAMYAYTGPRVYDITYAYVAIVGGVLALLGIMTSAWGRSVMANRKQRARRETRTSEILARGSEKEPPTVAAPREKKRFAMPSFGRKKTTDQAPAEDKAARKPADAGIFAFRRRDAKPDTESKPQPASGNGQLFAFRRREAPPPAPEPDAVTPTAAAAEAAPVVPPAEAPAPAAPAPAAEPAATTPATGKRERVTLKCPRCTTQFTVEGVRPIPLECPSCGMAGTI